MNTARNLGDHYTPPEGAISRNGTRRLFLRKERSLVFVEPKENYVMLNEAPLPRRDTQRFSMSEWSFAQYDNDTHGNVAYEALGLFSLGLVQ
jgi:hypothetical protein